MKLETIIYSFFGNGFSISPALRSQLIFFKKNVPQDFREREMYDLGCGDGRTALILKDILKAKKIYGYDFHPGLVKKAQKRGIETKVLDLEKDVPKGELAVMWGVLHHLKKQKELLERVKNNFDYFFIREPIEQFSIFNFHLSNLIELGQPFEREKIKKLMDEVFGRYKFYEHRGAIFAFWKKHNANLQIGC